MRPNFNLGRWLPWTLGALCFAAGGYLAGTARATGIPTTGTLTYSGLLEDQGQRVNSAAFPIGLSLWDDQVSTDAAMHRRCELPSAPTAVTNGRFRLVLPDDCVAAVHANPDLYVDLSLQGASLPRSKLSAVPYAVEASHAVNADRAVTAGSVEGSAWQLVPFEPGSPMAPFPDARWGSGFEFSTAGPIVCLRGLISPSQDNYRGLIATLPVGARPSVFLTIVASASYGEAHLELHPDGGVYFRDTLPPAASWVSLGGICFSAR